MRKGMRGSETELAKDKKLRDKRKRHRQQQRKKHEIVGKKDTLRTRQRIK